MSTGLVRVLFGFNWSIKEKVLVSYVGVVVRSWIFSRSAYPVLVWKYPCFIRLECLSGRMPYFLTHGVRGELLDFVFKLWWVD